MPGYIEAILNHFHHFRPIKPELAPHRYAPTKNTPGLWTHSTRPIVFALVEDDFGVKYVREEHAKHLLNILLENYEGVHEDWRGKKKSE